MMDINPQDMMGTQDVIQPKEESDQIKPKVSKNEKKELHTFLMSKETEIKFVVKLTKNDISEEQMQKAFDITVTQIIN